MEKHDLDAARILFLFDGILHINNSQGIDSFDMMKEESAIIIDEILNFKYLGENTNIKDGFSQINVWRNGLKLLKQRILELNEESS